MTLRLQIILLVGLLFLCVAAAAGIGAGWIERATVRNAFNDDARSLAIAMSEMIEPADLSQVRQSGGLGKTRLGVVWSRLQRWGIVKRLFLIDPADGRVLADTASGGEPLPVGATHPLGPGEVRTLDLRFTSDGHALQPLVAAVTRGGEIVGVEISADDLLANLASIRRDGAIDVGLALVLGLIAAAGVGAFATRPVRRLGSAVAKIGTPDFAAGDTESAVAEVADLGNTLSVMHGVLDEVVEKGRLSLTESDYYRSEADLAAVFRGELLPPGTWTGGGAEAVWLPVGSPQPPAFAGALALGPASGAAFAGLAPAKGPLASAVRARAAGRFLADALARRPLAEAGAETRALFGLVELQLVAWRGDALEVWRGGDAALPAPTVPAGWSGGAPLALACLGPVNRTRLELYLAHSSLVAKQLLAELPPLLDPAEAGIVLLLRRTPAAT